MIGLLSFWIIGFGKTTVALHWGVARLWRVHHGGEIGALRSHRFLRIFFQRPSLSFPGLPFSFKFFGLTLLQLYSWRGRRRYAEMCFCGTFGRKRQKLWRRSPMWQKLWRCDGTKSKTWQIQVQKPMMSEKWIILLTGEYELRLLTLCRHNCDILWWYWPLLQQLLC